MRLQRGLLLNQDPPRLIRTVAWCLVRATPKTVRVMPQGMLVVVPKVGFFWSPGESLFRILPDPAGRGWVIEQTSGDDIEARWLVRPAFSVFLPEDRFTPEERALLPSLGGALPENPYLVPPWP